MKILRLLILFLLPINLICQDENKLVLGSSFEKFIIQPHPKVDLAYGNLSFFNSNYIITPTNMVGLNKCGTEVILIDRFNGLIVDRLNLAEIKIKKLKQLKGFDCEYNYLLNNLSLRPTQIENNKFILGIVQKKDAYFYLRIEIKGREIEHSLEQMAVFNSIPQLTDEENKKLDKKIFPKCFSFENFLFFSYDKNIFYYNGEPLARCIQNKKSKNDSLIQYYFKNNVLYHNSNNKLTRIKKYNGKGWTYGISEDVNYVYYHNQEDLLVIDRNGTILLEEKLNHFFEDKHIGFKSRGFGNEGIYAIAYKNHIPNYNTKLTSDTLSAEIYNLEYNPDKKKIILKKKHTILSNYPIYCKQIVGNVYYFQHSFIKDNENVYAVKLNKDSINIITKYPKKNTNLFNVTNIDDFKEHSSEKNFATVDSTIVNYFKEETFFNYPKELKVNKKTNEHKNNTETQLMESILIMLDDTTKYEALFENYIVYTKGSKALENDTSFREAINKLKTEDYIFLIEELKEHLNSLLKNKELLAEYKNMRAYSNQSINKNLSNEIRFYPFIKRENKYYLYLSAPLIQK